MVSSVHFLLALVIGSIRKLLRFDILDVISSQPTNSYKVFQPQTFDGPF